MRLAAINLLVGAAERAEPLESPDQPEGEAGLLTPGAPAHDAIGTALGQRTGSFGYGFVAQDSRFFSGGSRGSSADHPQAGGASGKQDVGLGRGRAETGAGSGSDSYLTDEALWHLMLVCKSKA